MQIDQRSLCLSVQHICIIIYVEVADSNIVHLSFFWCAAPRPDVFVKMAMPYVYQSTTFSFNKADVYIVLHYIDRD